MKKVFAVILAIIVIIMVIFIIKGVLTKNKEQGKIASKDYFAAFKDNKWGVIDETGSVIIDPSYSEMIIVPNSKNDVFLCTYDVDYTTGTYKTKALNEKNEEIFVCNQSIQVYSLKGEYKRTLKINTVDNYSKVFNIDDEALLVYDDVIVDPGLEGNTKEYPYRLVSKKDGSLISVLNIHFPKRYSTRLAKTDKNSWSFVYQFYTESMYYGRDIMIADISSDTLYQLTPNRKLIPILTRKPSVHLSGDPRNVWVTFLTTDKFMIVGTILLDFNSGGKIPFFMYEFETGEVTRVSFFDAEYGTKWGPGNSPAIAKNKIASLIQPSSIIDAYEKKRLNGNVDKFIKTLSEDDNPVVRILKFK